MSFRFPLLPLFLFPLLSIFFLSVSPIARLTGPESRLGSVTPLSRIYAGREDLPNGPRGRTRSLFLCFPHLIPYCTILPYPFFFCVVFSLTLFLSISLLPFLVERSSHRSFFAALLSQRHPVTPPPVTLPSHPHQLSLSSPCRPVSPPCPLVTPGPSSITARRRLTTTQTRNKNNIQHSVTTQSPASHCLYPTLLWHRAP